MSKLTKNFKGQISHETEKAVEISIMTDTEMFNVWIPKSALNMKKIKENYLTVTGIQEFHIKQWFVDSKAKEETTKTEFVKTAERVTDEIAHIPDIEGPYDTSQHKQPKDIVIDMPQPPTPDRVEFPYFPGMTVFELRDYHKHEPMGAIRGHIENIIMDMKRNELLTLNDKVLNQLESIEGVLRILLEGKGK